MAERLGDRIRKAREEYGMSSTLLAQRAEISRQQLYMIESNQTTNPGVFTIKAIARVLHVDVAYLVDGTEKAREQNPLRLSPVGAGVESEG